MVAVSALGYFLPIFAFLLVFIVIFALLKKTGILGANDATMIFISFVIASFFVMEARLVEFIEVTSSWMVVLVMIIVFVMLLTTFIPDGASILKSGNNWFAWVALIGIFVLFIVSSAYVFNWAVNWSTLESWANTEWFGMILLIIVAWIVSWRITGKPVPIPGK